MPAGNGQTDDWGEHRIWGLNPGEYYVSAVNRNPNINLNLGGPAGRGGPFGPAGRGIELPQGLEAALAARGLPVPGDVSPTDPADFAYAPTYYPGVSSPAKRAPSPLA